MELLHDLLPLQTISQLWAWVQSIWPMHEASPQVIWQGIPTGQVTFCVHDPTRLQSNTQTPPTFWPPQATHPWVPMPASGWLYGFQVPDAKVPPDAEAPPTPIMIAPPVAPGPAVVCVGDPPEPPTPPP